MSAAESRRTSPPAPSGSPGTPGRLAWLDVLRGVAALCVVFDHFGSFMPAGIQATVNQWFDHPALIEVYGHLAWTSHRHSFWPQLLLDASFLVVLLSVCSLTYLLVERPMQTVGRWLARWLDVRFGPDRATVLGLPILARPRAVAE